MNIISVLCAILLFIKGLLFFNSKDLIFKVVSRLDLMSSASLILTNIVMHYVK